MKKVILIILSVCMIISVVPFSSSAVTEDSYAQSLRNAGFPESYVTELCELHALHPTWNFVPVNITGMKSTYTWDYVMTQEIYASGDYMRNLIYKTYNNPAYIRSSELVESGSWYRASDAAIAFFIDPRNFLNEKDIFQFETLRFSSNVTVADVESVLYGSFLYKAIIPDSGNSQTYAEYFYQVGQELGVSPMHLASRVRQEQSSTSPLISGSAGTTLWQYYSNGTNGAPSSGYTQSSLEAYNGYYNYFNVGATGTGKFNIILTGVQTAKNNGWSTRKASIYGGAQVIQTKYINDYQHTLYFQKFNTHPSSSRNFWGQYMQNVSAALSEGRNIQASYANNGLLDSAFTFEIPVYGGMPSTYGDPGTSFTVNYSYINEIETPVSANASNTYTTLTAAVSATDGIMSIDGWSVHSLGLSGYEYSLDYGKYQSLVGEYRSDVATQTPGYTNCTTLNAFYGDIPVTDLESGEHILSLRGKTKSNTYYVIAVITLDVTAAPYVSVELAENAEITISKTGSTYYILGVDTDTTVAELLSQLTKGSVTDANGNSVTSGTLCSGYKVRSYHGSVLKEEFTVIVNDDVNGDGIVNAKDIVYAKRNLGYKKAIDSDCDGIVTPDDFGRVSNFIVGN